MHAIAEDIGFAGVCRLRKRARCCPRRSLQARGNIYAKLHERTASANGKKAPLHRWEEQDEGSQQAQTAQKLSAHTTSYDRIPCERRCSWSKLYSIGWPTAVVMAMCKLGISTEPQPHFRKDKNRHKRRLPPSFSAFECSVFALLKAVWVVQR